MRKGKMATYDAWRYAIWTGDLIEWQSKSIVGRIIRWMTGRDVNHTSLIVRYTNFDTERVYNLEALAPGVYPNLLSRRLGHHRGRAFWLQLKPEFDHLRASVAKEGHKYVGTRYDFPDLFRQAFQRVHADARRFFCSELCYVAAAEAGLIQVAEDRGYPARREYAPRPGDFSKMGIYKERIQIL